MGGSSAFNPRLNFGQSEGGLFSREEIRRLMEIEFSRSQRYGYPLTLLLVEVDRLESLHDLYGVESKARIVSSVISLLRSSTRASDVLGCLEDERLLMLFPHTHRSEAATIARRLLSGCHELEFRGDGRSLRASLSIGSAQRVEESAFPDALAAAERALAAALQVGGDRLVEYESLAPKEPPRVARSIPTAPPVRPAPARAAPAPAQPAPPPPRLPDLTELAGASLEERVASLFELLGPSTSGGELAQEVLDTIHLTLAEARTKRATQAEIAREIELHERRVARLKELLGASEEDLARMVREKSADPGIASIYRSVQGLDPLAQNYAQKKELLKVIYQANVELLAELRGQQG